MRPITISLDAETWKEAKKKTNFSAWVRDMLRSERNKRELPWKYCSVCDKSMQTSMLSCPNSKCTGYLDSNLEDLE